MEKKATDSFSGNILIKQVLIADPGSVHNNQVKDILIADGIITKIGHIDEETDVTFDGNKCVVTPGLLDLRCRHGEPGSEQNEDIESLIKTAEAGGFTGVVTLPDTFPSTQSRAQIEYLFRKGDNYIVRSYPLGATTMDLEGEELTELYDMHQGGALGFSNADVPYNSGALQRAMLYTKPFKGLIFSHAEDKSLSNDGYVNESNNTAALGLKCFPSHSEYTAIAREIEIARYTDAPLHFSHISTAESVDIIRNSKKQGVKISCDVSILHLIYTDAVIMEFDSNLKLLPPLRSESDRQALIKGVNDKTIDCIVSDHNPQSPESKVVEFNYSPFGAITLQILYSLYREYLSEDISLQTFINATARRPYKLLNLEVPVIDENMPANLAIFDPEKEWDYNHSSNTSLSYNSHLLGSRLKGKCVFISNNKLSKIL